MTHKPGHKEKKKFLRKSKRQGDDVQKGKFGKITDPSGTPLSDHTPFQGKGGKSPKRFKSNLLQATAGNLGEGEAGIRSELKQAVKKQEELGVTEKDFGDVDDAKKLPTIPKEIVREEKETPFFQQPLMTQTGQEPTEIPSIGQSSKVLAVMDRLGFERNAKGNFFGGDLGVTAKNFAIAVGWGVAIATTIATVEAVGARLLATRGLSSSRVGSGARGLIKYTGKKEAKQVGTGLFRKKIVEGTPKLTKTVTQSGGKIRTTLRAQTTMNTVYANKTINVLSRVVAPMKNPTFAMGALSTVVGTTAWGEWGRVEGIDSLTFTYKRAVESGNTVLAARIREEIEEVTDGELLDYLVRITPFANIIAASKLKALGDAFSVQQTDFESGQFAAGQTKTQLRDKEFADREQRSIERDEDFRRAEQIRFARQDRRDAEFASRN